MRRLISTGFGLAVLLLSVQIAAADITRGCHGQITLQHFPVADIQGIGKCKNKANANDCRRRAHDEIRDCARALWATRWDHTVPAQCKETRGNRAMLRWSQIITRIRNQDSLKQRLEYTRCCGSNRVEGTNTFSVRVRVMGDRGCGDIKLSKKNYLSVNILSNYTVDCPALRAAGICGN